LKLYQRPDAKIPRRVLRTLRRQRPQPGARLRVEMNAGHVTVVGEIPHVSLVATAVWIVERTPGVDANGSIVSRLDGAETVVDLS
jgi:osmotically-inducible protein OsmY